jgi:hypothetical protein
MPLQHPSFFVFGPERSGTTLLTFLLSGQPGVFVLNDSCVFDRYVEWALLGGGHRGAARTRRIARLAASLAPNVRLHSIEDLRSWRRTYYAARARYARKLDPDRVLSVSEIRGYHETLKARYRVSLSHGRESFLNEYVGGLVAADRELTLRETLSHAIGSVSALFTDPLGLTLAEKTPIHTPYASWMMGLYPEAKAILMVRNPVSNVASIFRRYGDFGRSLDAYHIYAESLIALAENERVMTVRHEEVIASTRSVVQGILRFVDPALSFDPACPVRSYTKSEYTGNAVDASRVATPPDTLSREQEREIRTRFGEVERRFY